jgi:soluble lytic murein transglycosylase-like protein
VAILSSQVSSAAPVPAVKLPGAAAAVAAIQAKTAPAPVLRPAARPASPTTLRSLMKFETVRWGGKPVQTLDEGSRLLLARAAADQAGLREFGLSYQDVYGIIEAETSWIQRTGSSKDGTPNLGLAQFEPRTAKGLGLTDPSDPVQAVFAPRST